MTQHHNVPRHLRICLYSDYTLWNPYVYGVHTWRVRYNQRFWWIRHEQIENTVCTRITNCFSAQERVIFGVYFQSCEATRKANTKITLDPQSGPLFPHRRLVTSKNYVTHVSNKSYWQRQGLSIQRTFGSNQTIPLYFCEYVKEWAFQKCSIHAQTPIQPALVAVCAHERDLLYFVWLCNFTLILGYFPGNGATHIKKLIFFLLEFWRKIRWCLLPRVQESNFHPVGTRIKHNLKQFWPRCLMSNIGTTSDWVKFGKRCNSVSTVFCLMIHIYGAFSW